MKSIKEKAKAYDEAIKRAQAKMEEAKVFDYDDEQTAHTIRLTTTDIFPELKESEDERIRKGIIRNLEYLADRAEGFVKDELKERIVWLEKQGEQKPYGQREECSDCQFNYAGECKGYCAMKRGEQKPADTEKGAKGNEREIPNSAWSEEDEEKMVSIFLGIETFCPSIIYGNGKEEVLNWFKSLKDRVQSKQEWSEEDDALLYGVIETEQYMLDVVTGEKTFDVGNEQIESQCTKELAWLKILKDRYTWKPSEEQMEALDDFIYAKYPNTEKHGAAVKSLYQDLKKLKA